MVKWREMTKRNSNYLSKIKMLHPTAIFNQFNKIRNKIFSLTFLLLSIFGVMGLLVFQLISIIYEDKIYDESADNLTLSSHVLDSELGKIENLSFQLSTDDFMQRHMEYLKTDNYSFQAYRKQSELIERMTLFVNQESYISSVQVVDASGQSFIIGRATREPDNIEETIKTIEQAQGGNVWLTSKNKDILYSAREIKKKERLSLEHLGYLLIAIDLDDLIAKTLNYTSNNDFIIARGDKVIYSDHFSNKEIDHFLETKVNDDYDIIKVGGKEYFVTHKESESSNITYYNMRPFESVVSTKRLITRLIAGYFIFMVLLTIFLGRQSANAISKPIEKLTKKMKQVQKGDFGPVKDKDEQYLKDEIGDLQRNFHIMLDKINQLIKENYTKQLVIKETEYKALQSQINPHFLYNTLDSINWQARVSGQQKISTMVEALGNMMRDIISKKEPLITIKEELDIVDHYVTIQKYRYGERLNFKLEYDPELEKSSIPKLTIQPLVENAIQHGLEEMVGACYISVQLYFEDTLLKIIVLDNGPGIAKKTIGQIYDGNVKTKGSGIGLYNINERIQLMFGEKYDVKIESEKQKGTKVIITLPFMKG